MSEPSMRIALAAQDRPLKPSEWLRAVSGFHDRPGFWWLDSAMTDHHLGRHSFAGADPYMWFHARGDAAEIDVRRDIRPGLTRGRHRIDGDPIDCARSLMPLLPRSDALLYSTRTHCPSSEAPWQEVAGISAVSTLPFVGGAVGFFGYELASTIETHLHFENSDDLGLPDLSLAFVDRVLAYDHDAERLWTIGLAFAEAQSSSEGGGRRSLLARSREGADALSSEVERILSSESAFDASSDDSGTGSAPLSIRSTTDASGYAKAVDTILEEIEAGNLYQANFSQRLTVEAAIDPWRIYGALRRNNPAPFGAYLSLPGAAVLSSSPELFLRLDGRRRVESRPIKGTRPRGHEESEDLRLAADLESSEKDRAENLMIVDLVRNDLGRVCLPGSIAVPELMKVESYAEVFQMVSTVTGELAPERDGFDLIRATFPPGSMTGAPKLASIALLEKLERTRRGVYAGALGFLDLRGGLELAVVIRTIVWQDGRAHLHVGGGVVTDSSPEGEYRESLDKARAPLAALEETLGSAGR